MKLFWYKPINYHRNLLTAALESGADAVYVPSDKIDEVKKLAKVKVISDSDKADMKIGKDVVEVLIDKKEREDEVVRHQGKIPTIIKNKEWTIIPLENLLSKTSNLIQTVYNARDAKTAMETMERGADGILLVTDNENEIKKTGEAVRTVGENERLGLHEAVIDSVESVGMGTRVCVDTSSLLKPGEGLLCGDSSKAFFLVYNENVKNPYCDPRPFRVNAGAVHAYVRAPLGKTKYLGELESGDKILIVNENGDTRVAVVGRAKIEERPMMMVKAFFGDQKVTLLMQNAETIRLTKRDGSWRSVPQLKKGDKVLVYIEKDSSGRHFGSKIEETILEK